jgi:SAM-dependent methyltransferase
MKRGRKLLKKSYDTRDKLARIWSSGKILELGCGEFPLFENSTRIDIAKIDGCIQADCNCPLPIKEKFDVILALELIEHLWNVDNFLKECNRLLKLNGKLIISTPNVNYWKNRLKRLRGDYSDTKPCYFSPRSLKKKIEEYGFKVEVTKPLGRVKLLSLCGGFIVRCSKIKSL